MKVPMSKTQLKQLSEDFCSENPAVFTETFSDLIRMYGIADLAREADFNRISLWRYMKGEQDLKLATFIKMLKVLGISVTFHADADTGKMLRFLKWQKKLRASEEYEQFEKERKTKSKTEPV